MSKFSYVFVSLAAVALILYCTGYTFWCVYQQAGFAAMLALILIPLLCLAILVELERIKAMHEVSAVLNAISHIKENI